VERPRGAHCPGPAGHTGAARPPLRPAGRPSGPRRKWTPISMDWAGHSHPVLGPVERVCIPLDVAGRLGGKFGGIAAGSGGKPWGKGDVERRVPVHPRSTTLAGEVEHWAPHRPLGRRRRV